MDMQDISDHITTFEADRSLLPIEFFHKAIEYFILTRKSEFPIRKEEASPYLRGRSFLEDRYGNRKQRSNTLKSF